MSAFHHDHELLLLEDAVWVLTASTGLPVYDFRFSQFLPCRHPWQRPPLIEVVARIGAIAHYPNFYETMLQEGIRLIHTPDEHQRCSELPSWYPLLEDLTPKSVWFEKVPSVEEVTESLRWPVFIKGSRQTSRHRRSLSVITNPEEFAKAMKAYQQDSILWWQKVVCREFIPLRLVEDTDSKRLPSSFEFRTFWWKGELAGYGRYWWDGKPYGMIEAEKLKQLLWLTKPPKELVSGSW